MIYFLWDRKDQILKIGGTCRLYIRLSEQGVLDEGRLLLLGVMDGDKWGEKQVQTYACCLAEKLGNSDWFEPTKALADFVNRHAFEPTVFDWGRDASDDDVPHAPRIMYSLMSNARVNWLKRLGEHVGKPWGELYEEAIKAYAKSVGFEEPPDFPKPKRRKPLLKQDKAGNWWILQSTGQYAPGFFEHPAPKPTPPKGGKP